MLEHVRVIWAGLDGEVHRQLHAVRLDRLPKMQEPLEAPQLRRNRVMATVC